jgi:hypothetical protein
MNLTMMERVGDRWGKMEGSCSTGQSPPWVVVPVEEEEEEEEEVFHYSYHTIQILLLCIIFMTCLRISYNWYF